MGCRNTCSASLCPNSSSEGSDIVTLPQRGGQRRFPDAQPDTGMATSATDGEKTHKRKTKKNLRGGDGEGRPEEVVVDERDLERADDLVGAVLADDVEEVSEVDPLALLRLLLLVPEQLHVELDRLQTQTHPLRSPLEIHGV
eukprot:467886-Rhodomonas_salina.4